MSIEKESTKLRDTDQNEGRPTELDFLNEKHSNSGDSDDGSSSSSSSSSSESSETESLDGGWGWMVVMASFVAHVISDGCCYSAGVLLVEWLDVFEESKAKTSWIPALFVSMHAIFGPISSICTNKFGCRKTTIAGGAIACLGCILSVFANSVDQLCFTFGIVSGFGLSLVYVPAVIVVAFYFEKKRAFATGIAVAGSGIGGFLFPLLVEFLVETYSWRGAVLVMGGIMLNIILCGALFRPIVSFKEQRKKQKYLRSLEKFSRVSSQHQSWENIEQNGVCDHQHGEEKECVFCQQNQCDTPPMSRSLQQIPTYLDIESVFGEIPKLTTNTSPKHNSSSMINFSTMDRSLNAVKVLKEEQIDEALPKKILKKALKTKSKTGEKKEKKKAHFPDHIIPKYPKDIFYKGSLWKAGFLLGKGQSASCPDIFVRSKRKSKTIREKFKGFGLALKYMMDFMIFRSPVFMCFCFHSMLLYVSYDIPYMYLPDLARDLHISTTRASLLLSIAGIASTIGQIIIGYIGDRPQVDSRYLYVLMISVAGLSTLFVPIIHDYLLFIAYCLIFGFTISANYCLTTVIVVDLLGMEKLTNAYGFVTLSEGIANLIGVPLGGWITDTTGNYDLAFYLSGIGVVVSAMVLLLMPCLKRCDPLVKKKEFDDDHDDSSSSSDHLESNGINTAI